jgi:hypothetical protein
VCRNRGARGYRHVARQPPRRTATATSRNNRRGATTVAAPHNRHGARATVTARGLPGSARPATRGKVAGAFAAVAPADGQEPAQEQDPLRPAERTHMII